VYTFYRRQKRDDDARAVGRELVASLHRAAAHENGPAAARQWERAGEVYEFLGDRQQAVDCARNAVLHTPMNYHRRQRLARLLMANGEFDAALGEFEWCLHRRPHDQDVHRGLKFASQKRLVERDAGGLY
jgi:tetratricopeptide (TPR) repeat protein